jgi:hypothetical protein
MICDAEAIVRYAAAAHAAGLEHPVKVFFQDALQRAAV